jgi:hypothetical protein
MMNGIEGKETLSLFDLKGKIEFYNRHDYKVLRNKEMFNSSLEMKRFWIY